MKYYFRYQVIVYDGDVDDYFVYRGIHVAENMADAMEYLYSMYDVDVLTNVRLCFTDISEDVYSGMDGDTPIDELIELLKWVKEVPDIAKYDSLEG